MTSGTCRAALLLLTMAGVFVAIGSLFGPVGAAFALALAVVTGFWSFWSTAGKLAAIGAVEVTDPKIIAMVAGLAAKAGIPAPPVFEIPEKQPNALVLGPTPHQAALVLTTGLRKRLTDRELAAVVGHEIAHIRSRDTMSATIGVTILSAVTSLALLLGLLGFVLRRNGGGPLIALAILTPVLVLIVHLAASRSREYAADRFAAEMVGMDQMIAALRNLDISSRKSANTVAFNRPELASLFIVDPLPQSWLGRVFSTHPPLLKRIERLERMTPA